MKRLTEKRDGKVVIPLRNSVCGVDISHWCISKESDIQSFLSGDAADRLAAYEDTGMEPEEIKELSELKTSLTEAEQKMLNDYLSLGSLARLRELAEADRNGRLVVLPRKVGAMIWECGNFDEGNLKYRPFKLGDMDIKFGRSVFLTREDAEKALEKTK